MRIRNILIFAVVAFFAWSYGKSFKDHGTFAYTSPAQQTTYQKARSDQIFLIKTDDPDLIAAREKARATLSQFLKTAQAPQPSMRNFAVKIGISDGTEEEFFWIAGFKQEGSTLTGKIDNTPRLVKNVAKNQTVTFNESDITDWMYVEYGKIKGNFSACALLKNEPKDQADELKKRIGLECDA